MAGGDRTLERYELVERIAGGGMGEVFRAVAYGAHGFSKKLAVKRILPRYAQDPEFERRFIEEAKLAVSLTHANIIGVLDFGHMDGSLYLAMEYVDGLDLSALLDGYEEQGELVPIGAALYIASEVCKGLNFAHRQDIVHRDVSPANLLLSRAGEVKIADFGIARAASGATSQIETDRIIGKLRYMSPEQILGKRVDAQSDLFALGIVLWELLTGEQLITARDLEGARDQVCEMSIPLVSSRRPDIPDDFDQAIASMLERDRGRRSESARALLRVLAKCSYAVDPVPTAIDVADAVELAMAGIESQDSDGLDAAILAELGGAAAPDRLTRARATKPTSARTVTIFRGVVDERGIRRWSTAPVVVSKHKTTAPLGSPVLDHHALATIDVASGSRLIGETEVGPRRSSRLGWLMGSSAAAVLLAVAIYIGLGSAGSGRVPDATSNPATHREIDAASFPAAGATPAEPDAASIRIELRIASRPAGATVLIDDVERGTTPAAIALTAGTHVVVLRKPGYRDARVETVLADGESAAIDEKLVRDEGAIAIFSHPWANVYYRGRKVGQTPIRRLVLPTGSHRLVLENPVLEKKKTVRVNVPRRTPYRFNL